eukprot:CAMPEP_0197427014 /NCGR_PEP_ID=MMETSP1170-20131217/36976_1 /TAXON_ID=54406 /ORGANISM="Sarcinochrysis sp, Strain CCMP770" /LENGTH=79 /DNA_ID=CAMNT_0042954693 /DNA_START=251 /DNA_END=486 /DNA_ORIENTATION=+
MLSNGEDEAFCIEFRSRFAECVDSESVAAEGFDVLDDKVLDDVDAFFVRRLGVAKAVHHADKVLGEEALLSGGGHRLLA